jgi:sugar phosphate isomerase/epimerase
MVQLAVSTQLFGSQLLSEAQIATIAASGFRVVEVFAAPGHFEWQDAAYVERIARALRAAGLAVCSVHAPWAPGQDIAALDPDQRAASLRAVERAADALAVLSGRALVLHPGATVDDPARHDEQLVYAHEGIARVVAYCAERGLQVALENPPPYELAGSSADMFKLYRDFAAQPALQACFDTGHAHISPEGVGCVRQVPKELLLVHLSDNTGQADDHLPPPHGSIAWEAFFAELAARRFDGTLILELTDLPDPERILADGWAWLNHQWPVLTERSIA